MSEQTGKPAEQEIDLSTGFVAGSTPEQTTATASSANSVSSKDDHLFDAVKPSDGIGSALARAASPEELLDAIIATPSDQLIPWEDISLPSRGLYYNDMIPGGVVKIKAMGTLADKILATARLAKTGQSMDYLFENLVQLPNSYDAADLLSGDRTFLLYALRGITHGNEYEFLITCPNCDVSQNCHYDLNELQSTMVYGNPSITEPAKVVLPYLSEVSKKEVWVGVRFLRGKDISLLAQRQRFNKKAQGTSVRSGQRQPVQNHGQGKKPQHKPIAIDQTLTDNLNLIITSFMGKVSDPLKIKSLTDSLHSSDTAAIREFLKKYSPGIDTTITITCADCGAEFRSDLPITESFFRPTVAGGVRP